MEPSSTSFSECDSQGDRVLLSAAESEIKLESIGDGNEVDCTFDVLAEVIVLETPGLNQFATLHSLNGADGIAKGEILVKDSDVEGEAVDIFGVQAVDGLVDVVASNRQTVFRFKFTAFC
ncbi:hypothetical protein HG530_001276 [Fusarium avenaceum]|nr:hypothetical protein HG530_001276 [Fusarium avenaceum]